MKRRKVKYVINWLISKEWSMGCGGSSNTGQCPECNGVHEGWHGHPNHMTSDSIGHKRNCGLAISLRDLGEDVLFIGDYKSKDVYEVYMDDKGFYGTRIMSEDAKKEKAARIAEQWGKIFEEMKGEGNE